jgi:hypothetical protein
MFTIFPFIIRGSFKSDGELAAIQQGHVRHVAKPKAAQYPQSLDRQIEKKTTQQAQTSSLVVQKPMERLPGR